MKKKIIALQEELESYYIDDINKLDFDLFVYAYESGSYEGSGFAAWKKGKKYFYHEMGHCSCDGPTAQIETSANVPHTLTELRAIAEKSYGEYGKKVVETISKSK